MFSSDPHKEDPYRPENVGQQRNILRSMGLLYGVLRHLKVHLVQYDIRWPIQSF